MKITYNWLKDYIDVDLTPQALADELTNVGFEVEELTPLLQPFNGVVVGKVVSVSKHPDANKLSVCTVSDGVESFQVICGAANVAEGQLVPFAKVGARLPGGFKIKKAKIRGVESFGMICSKEELGLEKKSEGIWPFEHADPPGTDVYDMLNRTPDYIYDFFITPNRPDCLSLIGIAREVSAITGKPFTLPQTEVREDTDFQVNDFIKVQIHDTDGCPRYAARVIRNVTVAPSPEWMQQRLEAVGIRPINNIVDITNYVLMEMGQPLHAFDLQEIRGKEIHVRASKTGEKFTTLDDKERTLPERTVMICDAERAVAIGGIMGGQNSEVSQTTTDILLESAYFKPTRIAFAGKKLGLSSEASQRFERGTDPNNVLNALNRAAALMAELAGGKVIQGVEDVYPEEIKPTRVPFNPEKINSLLGTSFSRKEIEEKLQRLQLKLKGNFVEAPTFRVDLKIGVDLAEEVARLLKFTN
jgi:phenylalanyl-tRNA synthetase beta chain